MMSPRKLQCVVLLGVLVGALSGCGHNPNHDIDMDKAKAAADRVHQPPSSDVRQVQGHGG